MSSYANFHGTYSYAKYHGTCSYVTCHGMCAYADFHICFINCIHFGLNWVWLLFYQGDKFYTCGVLHNIYSSKDMHRTKLHFTPSFPYIYIYIYIYNMDRLRSDTEIHCQIHNLAINNPNFNRKLCTFSFTFSCFENTVRSRSIYSKLIRKFTSVMKQHTSIEVMTSRRIKIILLYVLYW